METTATATELLFALDSVLWGARIFVGIPAKSNRSMPLIGSLRVR